MPTTIQALVIIALVISPGYVFVQVAGDVLPFPKEPGDLRFLLPAVTTGAFVHLVMSFWTIRIVDYYRAGTFVEHPWIFVAWGAVTIFIAPVALGLGVGQLANLPWVDRLLDKIGLGYIDRMPSAWDYVLRLERPAYVRVRLKDGGTVGGEFSTRSFASTTPSRADIYLERVWQLDENDNFVQPLVDNWGVWIAHDTIGQIEFFSSGSHKDDDHGEGPDFE